MSSMDITEFLIACLDEDQAAAKAEPGGSWYGPQVITDAHGRPRWRIERSPFDSGVPIADCFEVATALHLLRHDPARVLREVAAKRELLEWCIEVTKHVDWTTVGQDGSLLNDPNPRATHTAILALKTMAAPYVDRPGFKEEWQL